MKKMLFFLLCVLLATMLLPVRPAWRAPKAERFTLPAPTNAETASLYRVLDLEETQKPITAVSVYCYGLATDRLAASRGLCEPTRVTFYFQGLSYLGATATYDGANEYFTLRGESAEQLDGCTYEQWLALRASRP